jgi:hypothetical protein
MQQVSAELFGSTKGQTAALQASTTWFGPAGFAAHATHAGLTTHATYTRRSRQAPRVTYISQATKECQDSRDTLATHA